MIEAIYNILRFIILVILQIVILDNIELTYFINPYLYVLFILMLPLRLPPVLVMIIAFATGMLVGAFNNTAGLHAAACTFVGFIRPTVLKLVSPREGYDSDATPTIRDLGLSWFMTNATIMVTAHHLVLLFLEEFSFNSFFTTLLRVILSSTFTMILILLSIFLFFKSANKR